ncbi:MAG: hypothetical protein ILO42_09035 [Clostridia bacterium]|nr:hypothetical protein [Clostridia bacterium]
MFSWIAENVAAFIVVIAVAALLALAVAALLRDKKKGQACLRVRLRALQILRRVQKEHRQVTRICLYLLKFINGAVKKFDKRTAKLPLRGS